MNPKFSEVLFLPLLKFHHIQPFAEWSEAKRNNPIAV
jgi:hypothetical protein